MEQSLSWKEPWGTDQGELSFLLWTVADLLPAPSNLKGVPGVKKKTHPANIAEQLFAP